MRGEPCAAIVRQALENLPGKLEIDKQQGRVIVETQLPWSDIQDRIESTGRKAVLVGFGGNIPLFF